MSEQTRRHLHCGCGESLCSSLYLRYRLTERDNGAESMRGKEQKGCGATRAVTDRGR